MKIVLNINIRSLLIFDRNLVGGDEVVRSSSFSACSHGGRGCRSAVLRGDHYLRRGLVVWWSELGGAARDVVDVVAVDVVGARRSRSGRGRRLGQLAIGDGVELYVVFIFGVGDAFHLLHGVDA